MNYRHAFHAGNFADVIKHAILARILVYLRAKPAAFRVIDTHAGAGLYDLAGPEANRSLEWRAGIGRLFGNPVPDRVRPFLAPYLDAVAGLNPGGRLAVYPGSPALARAWLRPQDRLIACEVEPNTLAALRRNLGRDRRVKVVPLDGWIALKAYAPPIERRGLIIVDPPFEEDADFVRLGRGLQAAYRKWPSGIYVLWYPVKGRRGPDALARTLNHSGISKVLRIEFSVGAAADEGPLAGCGLIVVNPPWTLEGELSAILPALASMLAGEAGSYRLDWLAIE